ncbi:MAG: hypothetical protein WB660_03330 [Candidatus Sulfotelmatobacter sp.]
MTSTTKLFSTVVAMLVLSAGALAQSSASATEPLKGEHDGTGTAPAPASVTPADIQALKDALAAQQRQIEFLTQQLQRQQTRQPAEQSSAGGAGDTEGAQAQPVPQQQLARFSNDAVVQQNNTTSPGLNLQDTQTQTTSNPMESSVISIHFRGITITPGGFAAAEFVRRSRALAADVSTPFNSLTMPGASQSSVPEFFGSARQSRPTVFIDGRLKNVELSSYVSADFLSAGVTSTSTQTDGYTLRLRQAWGQAKFSNGWSILGGQMWSLMTENKAGIGPSDDAGKTNDARPMTIDSSYNVGFTYARQYALRLTKDFGDKVWFAVAIENPQATLTTHGNGNNFLVGQPGDGKNLNSLATYGFNPSPDIIAKLAVDPGVGHYEVFGLLDRFTDRIFPCGEVASTTTLCGGSTVAGPNALGAYNASKSGGGFGANARWNFDHKHIVFGLHAFGGSGAGRYGSAQLSDLSVHANGTLDLIRGYQGLSTLEWHGKKLDVYFYTGAEYASRAYDFDPLTNKYVGYGAPLFNNAGCYIETPPAVDTGFTPGTLANCTSDSRAVIEGTAGFWYRFYNGPRGRFQFGTQYSYVTRQTWSGAGFTKGTGVTPEGLDNMVFTSFRYYLP